MATNILVPQLGNEVTEAEITEWLAWWRQRQIW